MFDIVFFILSFVAAITLVVAVHEYGHLIVGRLCGIEAEVFSVGLGRALVSLTDRRGTKWQIAPWPVGGYVMYRGDANMASVGGQADEVLSDAERRKTFPGAPVWARMAAVFGGPAANFIFAFLVFFGLAMAQGKVGETMTVADLRDGPWTAQQLRPGDEITAIGGVSLPVPEGQTLAELLPDEPVLVYDIRRDGQQLSVFAPYPFLPVVDLVLPRTAAADIGMRPGDLVLSIDGAPIHRFDQLLEAVETSQGQPLELQVWRAGETFPLVLVPRRTDEPQEEGGFSQAWRIGVVAGMLFEPETEAVSPLEAGGQAAAAVARIVTGTLSGIGSMITGAISSCNMSSPIGIAEASATMASQGASNFLSFVALLSVAIGLMNLFPIPVLDGGHLVLLGYEGAAGRPPHPRLSEVLTMIGMTLIVALMIFAVLNDILCP